MNNSNRRPLTENIEIQRTLRNIRVPTEGLSLVPLENSDFHIFDNNFSCPRQDDLFSFTFGR